MSGSEGGAKISVAQMKKELRELRKSHMPPLSKMKKHEVMAEIEHHKKAKGVVEVVEKAMAKEVAKAEKTEKKVAKSVKTDKPVEAMKEIKKASDKMEKAKTEVRRKEVKESKLEKEADKEKPMIQEKLVAASPEAVRSRYNRKKEMTKDTF
jgi:hypothetical protein